MGHRTATATATATARQTDSQSDRRNGMGASEHVVVVLVP